MSQTNGHVEFQGEVQWVTPWDGLLLEVRRSAHRVAWIDQRIEEILQHERQLVHEAVDGFFGEGMMTVREELRYWLKESRQERRHLVHVSTNAIKAGFAERTIQAIELEAKTIAKVIGRALAPLGMNDDQKRVVAVALREALEDVSTERRAKVLESS